LVRRAPILMNQSNQAGRGVGVGDRRDRC